MRNVFRALPLVVTVLLAACSAASQSSSVASQGGTKKIVLVAGRPSHPAGAHEHNAGVALFKKCLDEVPGIEAVARFSGWPADSATVFEGADAILIYADGGNGHPAIQGNRLAMLDRMASQGVGLAMIHYANEVPAARGGAEFQKWTGGYYETNFSVNPIWTPRYQRLPNHPITRGVQPFSTTDEWYFNMRFRPGMQGVTPILQAVPSDSTRDGPYVSPRGPYPHIQAAKGQTEAMSWAVERPDGGRGFGFTGGHYHANWGNESQRKLVLNAILWVAKAEVPAGGVNCAITAEDLAKNLDPK